MPEEYYDEDGFRLSFESDTDPEEKQYFMRVFPNVSKIAERKIHCTSCQTHIGTAPMSVAIIRMHPVLRVTHCRSCHAFYNSGEFDKGEDGSELYCRWCGQGGEVYCCSNCPYVFCKSCILKNLSRSCVQDIARNENWNCFGCAPKIMWHLRAQHWALMNFIEKQKKDIKMQHDPASIDLLLKQDLTTCCSTKATPRAKGNQTPSASGSKKPTKRTEGQDDADNVPLAKMKNMVGLGDSGSKKDKSLKPMVIIPPIKPSLLGKEKDSLPSPSPSPKLQKKQKHKNPSTPEESPGQSQAPPAKKSKKGNNEVVCTPDIMSIFNQMDETRTLPATTSQPPNVPSGVFAVGSPHNIPDHLNAGPATISPVSNLQTPAQVSAGTPKPKAILHKSIPRNLLVRLGPVESTSSAAHAHANQVAELASQTVRGPPAGASKQLVSPPVYTTFNGYRIDLHTAAQQGTFRLPNGKLIQVRKQTADPPASTVGPSEMAPGVAFGAPDAAPPVANRTSLTLNPNAGMQGLVARQAAPQVYTPLLHQQPPSSTMFPTVQPTLSYTPQQTQQVQQQQHQQQQMQHQLQQQFLQLVPPQSMQHQQQQPQPHPASQSQQQQPQTHPASQSQQQQQQQQMQQQLQLQQQQTQRQQLQQQILQRQRNRPAQRSKSQKQAQRQYPYQRLPPQQQASRPIPAILNAGGHLAPRGVAQQPNEQQMVPQTPHPPIASSPIQLPILQMLRGLVSAPHENTILGSSRKDFEEKLLGCVEACNHIIIKIHTLTQSNSFKTIRNKRDLKELFIHLSYLITYGIGRFNTLHDRCVEDVKKMGFTKPSDFVMMGEKISNRNPEDSEDDDDCEIVEENTTVIQVDSDDEAGAGGGRAGPSKSNAAVRANPPSDSPIPSSTGSILPSATFAGQQSLPNDSTVSSELNKSVEERTANSVRPAPEACTSNESMVHSLQTTETLQASTLAPENQDKTNNESMENSLENDRMEVSASSQQETTEPMQVSQSIGEEQSKSDKTPTVASLEKETEEGAKQTDITDSVELFSESEEDEQTKSNQVSSDVELEKETAGISKEVVELKESMNSLSFAGENMEKAMSETAKENEITEPVVSLESEEKDQTKSDQIPAETSLEKEAIEPTKENAITEHMESLESDVTPTKASLAKDTIDPAKENEITDLTESSNSEGGNQITFDQTPTEASLEKETVESVNDNEVTETMETFESTVPDGNGTLQEENVEPMEVSESQTKDQDNFNEVSLEDGMEKHSTDDALKISAADLKEVSTSVGEQLENVLAGTCLDKRVNEDSNASTLGSWESVENLMDDIRGEHVKKSEPQTENATEKCTNSDETVQPADDISQEKDSPNRMDFEETISETVDEKDTKKGVETKGSAIATCSSPKLNETENSNEEAVQDDVSVSKKLQDVSVSLTEDESNDKDLAVAGDDPAKQSNILLDENSKTSVVQEGSSERNTSISEEEQLCEKESELDPAKGATIDEVEQLSEGGASVSEVINLMEVSNKTDLNEENCSEEDFFDEESKIPERDSHQAAMVGLEDTVEQSVSGSSMGRKDSLNDILLDDLSSISSSSNDEYADAVTENMKRSAMKSGDRPVADMTTNAKAVESNINRPTTSLVVTNEATSSARQAQAFSSNTLERPIEVPPVTIATDRGHSSRTPFDQEREP